MKISGSGFKLRAPAPESAEAFSYQHQKRRISISQLTAILVATLAFVSTSFSTDVSGVPLEVFRLLSQGDQRAAEEKLDEALSENPQDRDSAFLHALCARSRFNREGALPGFVVQLTSRPRSPEGQASACVIGMDLASDEATALYFYNALLIVARQNSDSIPIRWLAAIMARSLIRDEDYNLPEEMRKRIRLCGIGEYQAVLKLMSPGEGPALLHQTLANLLNDSKGYDVAWKHREITLMLERMPWSLHAAAVTLKGMGRYEEAADLLREAINQGPVRPAYYRELGDVLMELGRKREAISAWERAASFNTKEASYNLQQCATTSHSLGDYTSAADYMRRALSLNPSNRYLQIWSARYDAILGLPGAPERVSKVGGFDFKGNPTQADNAKDSKPDPWFKAAASGDFEKIKALIPGTDINKQNPQAWNQTALMVAAQLGWEPMAAELVRAGADLNIVDSNKNSALHYASQFRQPRMVEVLLNAGANPNLPDRWMQTPLTMTACWNDWDIYSQLIAHQADIHLATPHGGTALHYAAGHGNLPVVKSLIAQGADVNSTVKLSGRTPLSVACREWAHSYIVEPLIAAGADVNAQDKDGRTALHHSLDPLLNFPLVEVLLKNGADPTLADNQGTTPILQARLLGFEEVARHMEEKVGRAEPFRFPKFESGGDNIPAVQQNASLYVLPILLAQGHPLGQPSSVSRSEKDQAKKELSRMFAIHDARRLKEEIRALLEFEPRFRDDAGDLSSQIPFRKLADLLTAQAKAIHASCTRGTVDESAWIQSHIIYLSDLGMAAGFLDTTEGMNQLTKASVAIEEKFPTWDAFIQSFVLGAQFHNGWEADRYAHICDRISESGLPWP